MCLLGIVHYSTLLIVGKMGGPKLFEQDKSDGLRLATNKELLNIY